MCDCIIADARRFVIPFAFFFSFPKGGAWKHCSSTVPERAFLRDFKFGKNGAKTDRKRKSLQIYGNRACFSIVLTAADDGGREENFFKKVVLLFFFFRSLCYNSTVNTNKCL